MSLLQEFPPEIIEIILAYADFYTLKTAKLVHPDWKILVEREAKKRCLRNFTKGELQDFTQKWVASWFKSDANDTYWCELYHNWKIWQDFAKHVQFTENTFSREGEDVFCISTFGRFVGVGLANGVVKVYDINRPIIKFFQNLGDDEDEVVNLHFVPDLSSNLPAFIIITYEDTIFINDFNNLLKPRKYQQSYFQKSFSAYLNNFAFISKAKTLEIIQISNPKSKNQKIRTSVSSVPLNQYLSNSKCNILKTSISADVCCILIDNKFKLFQYNAIDNNTCVPLGCIDTELSFSIQPNSICRQYAWIFHGEIIINVYYFMDTEQEIFEMVYIGDKDKPQCMKKTFDIWHIFKALVYVVFLYGNTMVLGCSNGVLYFYNVKNWEQFDMQNYSKQFQLPADFGPVRCVDVVERFSERVFYVSGDKTIYKICGRTNLGDSAESNAQGKRKREVEILKQNK